jgi:uncharacterized protein YjiS (DUF1127 family)
MAGDTTAQNIEQVLRRQRRRARSLLALLDIWRQRSRGRHELAMMNERELHDLGIKRCDALHEAHKPFWRA